MSEKWFEVFRAGAYPQATLTVQDLEQIADNHVSGSYSVPLVIGHPKTDDPAYGWVDRMRLAGDKLLVTFRDVATGLQDHVNAGRWKNVSVRLRQTGTGWQLRHVGLLGAAAPAVEGLEPIQFENAETDLVFQAQERDMTEEEKLRQRVAELEAAKKTAEERATKAEADFAAAETARKKAELTTFIEARIKAGQLTPAQRDKGLVDFMLRLDTETTVDFASGKKSAGQWMREWLESMPKQVTFSEVAGRGTDPGVVKTTMVEFSGNNVDQDRLGLHQKALAYAKQHNVTYEEALGRC